jgi:hypothetical protein
LISRQSQARFYFARFVTDGSAIGKPLNYRLFSRISSVAFVSSDVI